MRPYIHASHEGALRSLMIIHLPDGLKLPRGGLNKDMIRIWDLYPTFLELAKAEPHKAGLDKKPLMGKSFVSLLKGDEFEPENYFVSAFHRTRGVIADG
ncbi:alkaline phosphatase family protein [Marinoscillum furvescens]|uniref:Uncharacterized protein n=1 Tax=Marinoscillum furvescens DSM 4134 TaxID=1122208 RepID=A0A3D9KYX9_MARFU|nr:hypothetical protein [Marinoscillum furvescens]RED94675.1 hypothetical protein C7460_12070 [Marinoscillum furvescens DSM 4134]